MNRLHIAAASCAALSLVASPAAALARSDICPARPITRPLPSAISETSGLAQGRRDAGIFWTHNDAGNYAVLFAVTAEGAIRSTIKVQGARLEDWEDIDVAPCSGGNCLFIGDFGDNSAKRRSITIYRVDEPAPGSTTTSPAVAMTARYPSGPRDAEAMFILAGDIYIVTKGRKEPIELYRWPRAGSETVVTLEKVRDVLPKPRSSKDLVTAAAASPDGKWVAIRTYRSLHLYPAAILVSGASAVPKGLKIDLSPVKEPKGEGLVLANDGTIWLSTEAGGKQPPGIARMKCSLPSAATSPRTSP